MNTIYTTNNIFKFLIPTIDTRFSLPECGVVVAQCNADTKCVSSILIKHDTGTGIQMGVEFLVVKL